MFEAFIVAILLYQTVLLYSLTDLVDCIDDKLQELLD